MARSTLTVFFENPFWVGVYERVDGDRYEVCKITFGAEPKDYEVWDYLLLQVGTAIYIESKRHIFMSENFRERFHIKLWYFNGSYGKCMPYLRQMFINTKTERYKKPGSHRKKEFL